MKFTKTLAAAALLAGASVSAHASQLTANSSAFFQVYDLTNAQTYDLNLDAVLGLNYTSLLTSGNVSIDLSTDATWNSFAATLDKVNAQWGVVSGNLTAIEFTSRDSASAAFASQTALTGAASNIELQRTRINSSLVGNSVVVTDLNAAQGGWADSTGSSATLDTLWGGFGLAHAGIAYGASANFFADSGITSGSGLKKTFTNVSSQLGTWTLTGNTLSFTAGSAPSAVPLPAAVWMFGAGLMGMLGLNRRKSSEI